MRLEDWQKWLDTQFIDPATVAKAPEPAAEVPIQADEAAPEFAPVETPQPYAAAVAVEPAPARHPEPVPQPVPRESMGLVDEVEVPSIEQYLPFLRGSSPPPEPPIRPVEPKQPAPVESASPVHEAAPEPIAAEPAPVVPVAAAEPALAETAAAEPPAPPPAVAPVSTAREPSAAVENGGQEATAPEAAHRLVRRATPGHHRSRPAKHTDPSEIAQNLADGGLWDLVPRHIQTLVALGSDEVAQNSYKREFRESRIELIGRILDPTLSLEETARILNVCPTTVRRYTNRGLLTHQRTQGDQRRFKLSDVLAFLETQSRPGSQEGA